MNPTPPAEAPSPGPSTYTPDLEHTFHVALATARYYGTGRRQNPAEQQAYLHRIEQLIPRLASGPPFSPDELDTLRRACTGTLAALEAQLTVEGRITRKLVEFALARVDTWSRAGQAQSLVA
ncbi:hypothetical protein [Deinococcus sp. Leaf326]|uniref:hypothetical protein n=1 Tax=Deinococcus sp. Leaf326 TaxID=1736338 RepID=UPI0006FBDF52|nr:hypothetical protein [Deinococcus sp. Leaf326]KQR37769.1 hypothetical protein ASF71_14910 [Deinococcus sp. Leaf326]